MLTAKISGIAHAYDLTDPLAASESSHSQYQGQNQPQTLVFVHGWLLSRAYWQPLVQRLASRYRCLTYDLRGFGESTGRPEALDVVKRTIRLPAGKSLPMAETTQRGSFSATPYSLAAYAQDLEALLDELEIENTWLLGHSLGGSIALWAAYLLPERVKGVVCINAGGGIYIPNEFEKFRGAGRQMVRFRPGWLARVPVLPRVFSRVMVKQPLEMRWGRQRVEDFVRADEGAALGALLESTTEEEVHLLPQVVRQIEQPVHFITGEQDGVMLPRYVKYLASFHQDFEGETTVSEIGDCGHMAMVEQTGAVADIVQSVVERLVSKAQLQQ